MAFFKSILVIVFSILQVTLGAIVGVEPGTTRHAHQFNKYPIRFLTAATFDKCVVVGWSRFFNVTHSSVGQPVTEVINLLALGHDNTGGSSFIVNISTDDPIFSVDRTTVFELIGTVTSATGRESLRHVERYWTNITFDPLFDLEAEGGALRVQEAMHDC
ncbi:hypothetical protein SISNIDRAFT_487379 [Sistotremastrum niveocremeum HHB9708]|uniref:Uncharacterized protein n=1 Tax=Sistotremastrum niveocremeum HHB9708 TaxID=1314777 RepID=A0A164SE82_9AGAM|nr:hypothetical protein SISNIDRAFT_487379 [Sistotremastrum niveocremeum HHB9708]